MKNTIKRICGYAIGLAFIYAVIPNNGLKEFCFVTIGSCIIILTALAFQDK